MKAQTDSLQTGSLACLAVASLMLVIVFARMVPADTDYCTGICYPPEELPPELVSHCSDPIYHPIPNITVCTGCSVLDPYSRWTPGGCDPYNAEPTGENCISKTTRVRRTLYDIRPDCVSVGDTGTCASCEFVDLSPLGYDVDIADCDTEYCNS